MSQFIICYDISDPRRLGRLHRYLQKLAAPIQYSVFLFTGDDRQIKHCMEGAEQIIDKKADDLRAYPLPHRGFKARLGKGTLPEGIQWSGMPAPW